MFTDAVEWAGVRLGLGHGAVGSVLAAVAMAVSGIAALVCRARRGSARLRPGPHAIERDPLVVLGALPLAIAAGPAGSWPLRLAGAAVLVAAYAVVTWKTIIQGRQEGGGEEPASLYFDTSKDDPPTTVQVLVQTLTGESEAIGGATPGPTSA